MALKPAVKVEVGEAHGKQGLPGCYVMSSRTREKRQIRGGDDWHFTFPDPETKLTIGVSEWRLPVTITNLTTVPLTVTTQDDGHELTDILGHNKKMRLADGARVTVEA